MSNIETRGKYSKQAHVNLPEGSYEEEHGRNGFFGNVSHIYHTNPLTSWSNIEGPLRPMAIENIFTKCQGKVFPLLENDHLQILTGFQQQKNEIFTRNADFDELYFIHSGEGVLDSIYGHLNYKKGDYIIVPRGTTIQLQPTTPTKYLQVNSRSEFRQPDRGMLGPNALYDQTCIQKPIFDGPRQSTEKAYYIDILREGKITTVTYPFHPFDAIGWKGNLYPYLLSIYDICPIMSHRYHIPPSGHTTFVANQFVICSFVARPLEDSSEGVLKVPFYHSNIDFDEVIFYHQGEFFSRDHISPGALTFHPQGIHHGPHPNAYKKSTDKTHTDEFAVMIDSKYPLKKSEHFQSIENQDYWRSWQ